MTLQGTFLDCHFDWGGLKFTFEVDGKEQEFQFDRPMRMWNSVLGTWGGYCPTESNRDCGMIYGDENVILTIEEGSSCTVTLQLPHMKTLWYGVVCNTWKNKEEILCN